jgi:hypothetical protein
MCRRLPPRRHLAFVRFPPIAGIPIDVHPNAVRKSATIPPLALGGCASPAAFEPESAQSVQPEAGQSVGATRTHNFTAPPAEVLGAVLDVVSEGGTFNFAALEQWLACGASEH